MQEAFRRSNSHLDIVGLLSRCFDKVCTYVSLTSSELARSTARLESNQVRVSSTGP